ncbi:MAG: hypothetical protein WCJ64_04525 [Rhodospirillaceae bacterium]
MTCTETIRKVIAASYGVLISQLMTKSDEEIALMDLRWLVFQAQNLEDKRKILIEYRDLTGCDNLLAEFEMEQDNFVYLADETVAIASDVKNWLCLQGNTPFLVKR